jgi:ornithine cyclodeaminase/alanine dehydrogenase-like protein (mu-crystallin family)
VLLRGAREAGPDAFARRPPLAQELEAHHVDAFDLPRRRGGLGEVQDDEREAGLERDLGRAERMRRIAGADPEEPPQIDVRGAGVERIFRIDERAQFSRAGGGGERGAQQRGTAGRCRSGNLVQFTPAESTAEGRIQRGRAGGEDPTLRRRPGGSLHHSRSEQLGERAWVSQEGDSHPSDLSARAFSGKGRPYPCQVRYRSGVLFLSRADVERCGLTLADCIEACEEALSAKAAGLCEMPPKLGVSPHAGALFHAMPARIPGVAGLKWISVFPDRRPALTALIVLNDLETGAPLAILEGAHLTALRTPAATAIAARRLASADVETTAVIGPGQQGRAHLAALRLVLPRLRRCRAWAPSRATAERFAAEMSREHGLEVEAADSAEAACRDAHMVVTCAPWPARAAPSLPTGVFARGAFVCTIDYDASLSATAAASFDRRFTDDVAQMKLARAKGSFSGWPDDFAELHSARRNGSSETILCANLGLAIFDLAAGAAVLRRAQELDLGTLLST